MQTVTVTGAGPLSYKILKDFHSTAQAIYEYRTDNNQNVEEENHHYQIDIMANDESDAKEIFLDYIRKLNELGVAYHHTHLNYIAKNIVAFEGNYINEEAILHDAVSGEISTLKKLVMLTTEDLGKIKLEYSHRNFSNKEYDKYTLISSEGILKATLKAAIDVQFDEIKSRRYMYSYQLNEAINSITNLDVASVDKLASIVTTINPSHFRTQLIYTVCLTILNYLNEASSLNPNGAFATNDQLRVIWATCKLHGLLDVDYEGYDPSEINYIRSVLTNRSHPETMLGTSKPKGID